MPRYWTAEQPKLRPMHPRHADSMREIDLILVEDDMMMRRYAETDRRARALQTMCMLLMLTALLGMFVHALSQRDVASIASLPLSTVSLGP
jgi:hypothetical protein